MTAAVVVSVRALRSLAIRCFIKTRFENVQVRSRVGFEKGLRFSVTDNGALRIGSDVRFDRNSTVIVQHGCLSIGDGTYIGIGSVICAHKRIAIGKGVLIAEHVSIRDQNHIFGRGCAVSGSGFNSAPVEIEDNVWIGAKATITAGVTIGANSVIGAGAVVTCNIPANSVAVGIPARVARSLK
ncbi:acyltransferase [Hoeflea sp. TYP-13]|uniref:acyltransferase n=1 Tax=Hoeflea sp. TYP-13 TaxID=3230023 RepID=UPI0034C67D57